MNEYKTAEEVRLERLFATWHHLVQTHNAGHEVHREFDLIINEVFNELGLSNGK